MKRTVRLILEYNGSAYRGFQRQKEGKTIQSELEEAIEEICRESCRVVGAGRTDAGVHALAQVCHFKTSSKIPCVNLLRGLNSLLPRDIVVREARDMPERFHARFSATRRAYAYFLWRRDTPSALFYPFLTWVPKELDVKAMDRACRYLKGAHDFSSFGAGGSNRSIPRTTVYEANCFTGTGHFQVPFSALGKEVVTIHIEAQNFLRNMVRIMVGTLLDVGLSKRKPEEVKEILEARDRKAAGPTASPGGLFLIKINYPEGLL